MSQILSDSLLLARTLCHLDVAPMALKTPELISIWLGNYNILCVSPKEKEKCVYLFTADLCVLPHEFFATA